MIQQNINRNYLQMRRNTSENFSYEELKSIENMIHRFRSNQPMKVLN